MELVQFTVRLRISLEYTEPAETEHSLEDRVPVFVDSVEVEVRTALPSRSPASTAIFGLTGLTQLGIATEGQTGRVHRYS
jgi:hypothetical protein